MSFVYMTGLRIPVRKTAMVFAATFQTNTEYRKILLLG